MTSAPSEEALRNTGDDPSSLLVAVDSSNGATRVLSMATRLARTFPGASLHVVHVFRVGRFDRAHAGAPPPPTDALADAKDHLEAFVRAARSQCRNQVTGHFGVGNPLDEVLRLRAELEANLLVIGTHDHEGFERLLLGSVAEALVRKAGCSVLVVRPTKG
jgi:universal stress protein A